MSFKDKIAMISGAGGGMGLKVAQDLLAAGAAVILLDQKPTCRCPTTRAT